MKLAFLSALALLLASAPAWAEDPAASPSASVEAEFAEEDAALAGLTATSTGGVEAALLQHGSGNRAVIDQRGVTNASAEAWIYQNGDHNSATLTQSGADNSAKLSQTGSSNTLDLTQQGDANTAVLEQLGIGLTLGITQFGGAVITITQTGP